MTARKIKNSWWIDFRFNHTRYRKRSPENSRAGALAYEATLRQKLAHGDPIGKPPATQQTFEVFADKWFDEYVVPNNKYSEQRTKRFTLTAALLPFFGKLAVSAITVRHIEQFRARQLRKGLSNKTINNQVAILNRCLSTGYEWLDLPGAPPKTRPLNCPPPQTRYLHEEDCKRLLACADGLVRDMILVGLRAGLRRGEIKALQWPSIDWTNRILIVRHSYCEYGRKLVSPKSNRERHIPLDSQVYDVLSRRRQPEGFVFQDDLGDPLSQTQMAKMLARACSEAGMRRITWHVLRHTFASHLAMRGVPLNAVQALLGHSEITTTMRYAHVAPSTLRSAIDLLNPASTDPQQVGQLMGNPWQVSQQRMA